MTETLDERFLRVMGKPRRDEMFKKHPNDIMIRTNDLHHLLFIAERYEEIRSAMQDLFDVEVS